MPSANPFDTYRNLHEDPTSGFGVDSVTLDVPLLIRIMEVCREEIKDDKELHEFATQIVAAKDRGVLGMKDWDDICTCGKKKEDSKKKDMPSESVSEAVNPIMAKKHLEAAKFHHDMAHFHAQKNHEAMGDEHHLDAMVHHGDMARKHAVHAKTSGATSKELAAHAGHYADGISEEAEMDEAYNLSPEHRVEHDARSAEFAKHYVAGHKGDHSSSGPTAKHEKDAEHFHSTYSVDHVRTGFAGSGTSVYTHKATGHRFQVNRTPSGKGFYGTNHNIKTL